MKSAVIYIGPLHTTHRVPPVKYCRTVSPRDRDEVSLAGVAMQQEPVISSLGVTPVRKLEKLEACLEASLLNPEKIK